MEQLPYSERCAVSSMYCALAAPGAILTYKLLHIWIIYCLNSPFDGSLFQTYLKYLLCHSFRSSSWKILFVIVCSLLISRRCRHALVIPTLLSSLVYSSPKLTKLRSSHFGRWANFEDFISWTVFQIPYNPIGKILPFNMVTRTSARRYTNNRISKRRPRKRTELRNHSKHHEPAFVTQNH